MLKTTQRDPIVGISVEQLWGLKLFLSDTRGPALSVMRHRHWQGWWVSKKLKRPWKELMALSTVSDFVFPRGGGGVSSWLSVCAVSWNPTTLDELNGILSAWTAPRVILLHPAPSQRFCVCLIHVYLQAKGGREGGGEGGVGARRGNKGERTKRGQGRSRGVTGSQSEGVLINELFSQSSSPFWLKEADSLS